MLAWTDRHFRYLMRLITRHTLLYTEMVTTGALLHSDVRRLLAFDPSEHPIALQLGGADPNTLATCARLGVEWGYDEINLNVGCPSHRVQNGRFGACLMAEPALVADCIAAMKAVVNIPVTIKTRIGLHAQDDYEHLAAFTAHQVAAGCDVLIVHARSAHLTGLTPRANRQRPPLRYELVTQLKTDFPQLPIIINGGITSLDDTARWLMAVDGVMIGRAAYRNPWIFATADAQFFNDPHPITTQIDLINALLPYAERCLADGVPLNRIARHLHGLFQGQPGARAWRRYLSIHAHQSTAGIEVLQQALQFINTPEWTASD